jgi:hypothetical protein
MSRQGFLLAVGAMAQRCCMYPEVNILHKKRIDKILFLVIITLLKKAL